jgi:hypothetical protein
VRQALRAGVSAAAIPDAFAPGVVERSFTYPHTLYMESSECLHLSLIYIYTRLNPAQGRWLAEEGAQGFK